MPTVPGKDKLAFSLVEATVCYIWKKDEMTPVSHRKKLFFHTWAFGTR